MNPDGSDWRRITTEDADDFDSAWASDGGLLVFDSYREGNWDIYLIEPAGTNTMRLTTHVADDESPAWRP